MYLGRLFKQNKVLFVPVLVFSFLQLFNNIRQDASISPVFTYGMYSQIIRPQEKYFLPEIMVNGYQLETKNFSPQQWDKIVQPIILFSKQQLYNDTLFKNHIQPLLHVKDSARYTNQISAVDFEAWYKRYLQSLLSIKTDAVTIHWQQYYFTGSSFKKI